MKVKCKYTGNGCKEVIKLEVVNRHENNCQFRMCDDCGLEIKLVNCLFNSFWHFFNNLLLRIIIVL